MIFCEKDRQFLGRFDERSCSFCPFFNGILIPTLGYFPFIFCAIGRMPISVVIFASFIALGRESICVTPPAPIEIAFLELLSLLSGQHEGNGSIYVSHSKGGGGVERGGDPCGRPVGGVLVSPSNPVS